MSLTVGEYIDPEPTPRKRPIRQNRSDYFIESKLKKGRYKTKKRSLKILLSEETYRKLNVMVSEKHYSVFIDLAIRIMYELVTIGNDLADEVITLKHSCTSPYIINNIERLDRMIKA